MAEFRRPSVPPWVVLLGILVVTAVWSLFPLYSPRTPGTLHLAVIEGEDPGTVQRAFGPLIEDLGRSVRRAGVVRIADREAIGDGTHAADLLLVTPDQPMPDDHEILAWTKPIGRIGLGTPLVLVTRRGQAGPEVRWALGDPSVLGGPEAAREDLEERGVALGEAAPIVGRSPYRHDEVIALLHHAAVDRIVVRRDDVERATAAGRLDPEAIRVEVLQPPSPRFALVASPSLSGPARRRLRARALDLDVLRLNPRNGSARAVANALGQLGLGGFAPTEPFPSLRP